LLIILAASKAEAAPSSPDCTQVAKECVSVIEAADRVIKEMKYQNELEKELVLSKEKAINRLQSELDSASLWYKQPGFVAPIFLIVGISLGALGGR